MVWSCLPFIRSGQTILQDTVKEGRRQGGQRKRWEDNNREWTGLEFGKFPEGSGEQGKMDKTGCEIICGAPVTLMVKGLMMMMVMIRCTCQSNQSYLTDCGGNIFFQYRSLGKETAALFSTLSETSFSGSLLLHAKGNWGSWGLGIFISNTYSLYCHHQNDSALRWAAV